MTTFESPLCIRCKNNDGNVVKTQDFPFEVKTCKKFVKGIPQKIFFEAGKCKFFVGLKTRKIPGKQTSEHYKCPLNTVKAGSYECPKDEEDNIQLKARKAKDTGIQMRMVSEGSYKPARTYTLNNISIDEFTMDKGKQRYPIKDVSKVISSMPDKISSTIKKIEIHEGPSPMTEEISKKLGVHATIDADAEYTTGKIRIWNGSTEDGETVDSMKLLQENLPHEAAHLVDRMTLSQSPDYAAAVESDGGWATGYAKDTAELDLKAGYGEDFADSVSEWVTARRSKADMGSHRLANRFKYFEEVLGQ